MLFELKDYQADMVGTAVADIDDAFSLYSRRTGRTAIGIAAPTGAGKTVVAAGILEQLYFGAAGRDPHKDLTVLWVTDDGDLNEQSREKIALASDLVSDAQMLTIDSSFDQRTFDPGTIYFLNVQKLGESALRHIRVGESRRHSLWETIGATVAERGADFLVIIDEAHRGSGDSEKPTILRRIIDGGPVDVRNSEGVVVRSIENLPAPVVVGISATPQKFQTAMSATTSNRSLLTIVADNAKVRASGLIKDIIEVNYSTDDHPTDNTLVRVAVADLIASDIMWEDRRQKTEGRESVKPLLVVQVPDKIDAKRLAEIVQTLTESWAGFDGPDAIAHSFGEHTDINMVVTGVDGVPAGRSIRYVSPPDIAKSTQIRAVIFKKALTTGWDCPRAEVMVSLRTANEYTEIAQLIGRMVRNPLARAIEGAEFENLNAVALYLPKYNEEEVTKVIRAFKDDEDVGSDVRVNPVTLYSNPDIALDVWGAAGQLLKELKPERLYRNEVQRLNGLATILECEGFDSETGAGLERDASQLLSSTVCAEYEKRAAEIDEGAAELLTVTFSRKRHDQHTGSELSDIGRTVDASRVDVTALEAESRRTLPENASFWIISQALDSGVSLRNAIARAAAMGRFPEIVAALNKAAVTCIDAWREQFKNDIGHLTADKKREIGSAWQPSNNFTTEQLTLAPSIRVKTQVVSADGKTLQNLEKYARHLYADGDGNFPEKFTTWEEDVLLTELNNPTLLAWYRNPINGLSISYIDAGINKSFYPDFLFFYRAADGSVLVDIVDPHMTSLADSGPKWAALTRYAREHSDTFRRVVAVVKVGAQLRALNLKDRDQEFEDQVGATSGKASFEQLFLEMGGAY